MIASVPTVSRLSVAPVKSLALLHPDEVALEATGARDDRRFYLVDEEGRALNGLRLGALAAVRPAFDAEANYGRDRGRARSCRREDGALCDDDP